MNKAEYELNIKILLRRIAELEDAECRCKECNNLLSHKCEICNSPLVSKLKIFIEVFMALSGQDRNDVNEQNLITELIRTTKFTEDEAKAYIKKALHNGQIYERQDGILAKTPYVKQD